MSVSSIMGAASTTQLNRLAELIGFTGRTYGREAVSGAIQALVFRSDGDLQETGSVGTSIGSSPGASEWHNANPGTTGSEWEIEATNNAAFTTSPGVGFHALSSNRTWTVNATDSPVTATFTIRLIADTNISKSVSITLTATDVPK